MDTTEKFDATAELKVTIAEAEKNLKSKRFAYAAASKRLLDYPSASRSETWLDSMRSKISRGLRLSRTKDAASDAGQKGMYRLAAEIETYKRNSATSTTATTNAAKRDVMRAFEKMLTAFEEIGASLAPADEGETKLAGDFEKVYVEFMEKFTKFGMSPFEPAAGDNFDKVKHEVVESVDGDGDVDTVLESKRRGYQTASGDVVRKARCTVSKARAAAATDAEPAEEAAEEKAE